MSQPIEAAAALSEIRENTHAMRDAAKAVRDFPAAMGQEIRQTTPVVGQEMRDTAEQIGWLVPKTSGMSLAVWLLIVVSYKLLKKWLGI